MAKECRRPTMPARADVPQLRIVDGEFIPSPEIPFSDTLDELIAEIRAGRAPNLGRFCGFCSTPIREGMERCSICRMVVREWPALSKIPRPLAAVYTKRRRREARIIHGAACLGLAIGVALAFGLALLLPGWTKIFAILFMVIGSIYIASYLGNVLVQSYAYTAGLKVFARGWQEYLQAHEDGALDEA